jgi:hypothetical protein
MYHKTYRKIMNKNQFTKRGNIISQFLYICKEGFGHGL